MRPTIMNDQTIPQEALAIRARLRDDFEFYAPRLKVRTKKGGLVPFRFNSTQRILHAKLEEQRERMGRVRAIVLKGRQQGASTYIGGRFYQKTTHRRGVRARIVAHTDDATSVLFDMVDRFHEHIDAQLKASTSLSNARELVFDILDSGYRVNTAGGREIGRGDTVHYLHASEYAFWQNPEMHSAGLMQCVPQENDTEIIKESTANGFGGAFHTDWKDAVQGHSDEIAVFLAWFIHDEYRREAPTDWEPSRAWLEYAETYGLTRDQLYWAYTKSRDLGRLEARNPDEPCPKFRQEYPATPTEAFQMSGVDPFIRPEVVAKARKRARGLGIGPVVIGFDPGLKDGAGVMDRQGRQYGARVCERWHETDYESLAGRLSRLIRDFNPALVNIDVTGVGRPVADRMHAMGFTMVRAVGFAEKPVGVGPRREHEYYNRRAEFHDAQRHHLETEECVLPDRDDVQMEFCAASWGKGATRYDASGRLVIEPKEGIIERLGFSPDIWDAGGLTHAAPVYDRDPVGYVGQTTAIDHDPLWD